MTTCAQKQALLAEAETALHKLMIGSKVESIHDGEKTLQYSRAELKALREYVQSLRDQVAACTGATTLRRRVIGIIPT